MLSIRFHKSLGLLGLTIISLIFCFKVRAFDLAPVDKNSERVQVNISAPQSYSKYVSSSDSIYRLSGHKGELVVKVQATDQVGNFSSEEKIQIPLPNPDKGEFQNITLQRQKNSDRATIRFYLRSVSNDDVWFIESKVEMEPIKGTWNDFERGLTVELKLTNKGEKQYRRYRTQALKILSGLNKYSNSDDLQKVNFKINLDPKNYKILASKNFIQTPFLTINENLHMSFLVW